jgi:hypothetical protein
MGPITLLLTTSTDLTLFILFLEMLKFSNFAKGGNFLVSKTKESFGIFWNIVFMACNLQN